MTRRNKIPHFKSLILLAIFLKNGMLIKNGGQLEGIWIDGNLINS